MKKLFVIFEISIVLVAWFVLDLVIFLEEYTSTPYYYDNLKFNFVFKLVNHLLMFFIPLLYGLKVAITLGNKLFEKNYFMMLWTLYIVILLGIAPHVIFWLHRICSFLIYGHFFFYGLFFMVVVLLLYLFVTFLSIRKISSD